MDHLIVPAAIESIIGLFWILIILTQSSATSKKIIELVRKREKRIEDLLRDESVIHQLIKDKLDLLEHKNREDLKESVTSIISIITKKMT